MTGRIALLLCLGAASAAASDRETRFRYWKEMTRPDATGEEIVAAALDSEVYAVVREGFPDLRVLDDLGAEVPFVVEPMTRAGRTVAFRELCSSRVDSFHVEDGEALEVVVALESDARSPHGLTIQTPLVDFDRRVRVYGDRDGAWVLLSDEGRIFDYTRFMNFRSLDVSFPDKGLRRYRIVVEHERDELESPFRKLVRDRDRRVKAETIWRRIRPFRIDGISLWRTVERNEGNKRETFSQRLLNYKVANDVGEKTTRVDVDAGGLPLDGIRLATSSRNFSRPARVLAPVDHGGREEWAEIGRGTLALVAFRGLYREETTIEFPERRCERVRLVVENSDNAPLQVAGIEGRGPGYQVVYLGEPSRRYRLFYGADAVDRPRYDAATVLGEIGRGRRPTTATLGARRTNAHYRRVVVRDRSFDGGAMLMPAIVAMVVVLAWALANAGRRLKKTWIDDPGG